MMPNEDPPANWPKPSRSAGRVLSAVGFGLLALITAAVVIADFVVGDYGQGLIWAVAALMFAHLSGLAASMLRRPAPADPPPTAGFTDEAERGLAFAYARSPYYWLCVVLAAAGLFAVGFAIVFAYQATATGWVFTIIFAAVALYLGWFLVVMLRLAPGMVVLTPTGIYHRGLAHEHFVPWEAVVDVHAREGRTPWITIKAMPANGTRERRRTGPLGPGAPGLPFMIVQAHWLGTNAVPAYRALRHYFDNPARRTNLGNEVPGS
jgi:hypothetical protein